MNTAKIIKHISKFIKYKGYICEPGIIENLYMTLKSKPFLMLAGQGNSEKYTFIKLFCESIGITSKNGRFKFVSPGGICDKIYNPIGHIVADGSFCPGEVLKFIIKASQNPDSPHVLYIDNLNMVNPDLYLRDILKAMDTVETDGSGKITSEPVFSADVFETQREKEMYGNIMFPQNLYIISSICRDESCYVVSSGMTERANVMEFTADSMKISTEKSDKCEPLTDIKNEFLKSEFVSGLYYDETAQKSLQEINKILKHLGKEFGCSVIKEIMTYIAINHELNLLSEDEAFDNCLLQRILTRMDDCKQEYKNILPLLFRQCVTKGVGDYYANSLKMHRALSYPDCRYKKSAEKIALMTRRIEENVYCTF